MYNGLLDVLCWPQPAALGPGPDRRRAGPAANSPELAAAAAATVLPPDMRQSSEPPRSSGEMRGLC